MKDYPKGVVAVYDAGENGPIDRYSVYFSKRQFPYSRVQPELYSVLAMNAAPFHPQGFGQHSSGMIGKHNGRKINFADLPPDCRLAVMRDLRPE